ncbi:uncharacterized protein LOC125700694 [Lagopus muta]|uniref:uncharacterized protein LOC125700694 n=1 Tax=Lagopus muta TaxID=64668 RepID=UPI00209F6028|nr:uncharacterized protein LOC125700694 [Lagopus muta]XP_048817735.1 uncharacterized protein LOC125700694 [Lagopus muta]XP_048817736.1 uncharacterized protein LOC125700694 [Lagopus muta]XP_048817737.1 uncharacterized protein LOC125700694 [Lagopus muta]XP_048817738.1 uncharacterized protein LOC125700694 [Lagopus muta]
MGTARNRNLHFLECPRASLCWLVIVCPAGGSRAALLLSTLRTARRCAALHGSSRNWNLHFLECPGTSLCWPVIVCPAGKGSAHPPLYTHYLLRHKVGFPELISALHGALNAVCPFLSVFSSPPAFLCCVLLALAVPYCVLLPSCFGVSCGILLAICPWPPLLRSLWPLVLAICATFPWPLSLAFFATFPLPSVLAFPTTFSLAFSFGAPGCVLFGHCPQPSLPHSLWPLVLASLMAFSLAFGFGVPFHVLFGHCPWPSALAFHAAFSWTLPSILAFPDLFSFVSVLAFSAAFSSGLACDEAFSSVLSLPLPSLCL